MKLKNVEFDLATLETVRRIPEGKIEGTFRVTQISTAHGKVSKRNGLTFNYILEIGLQSWAHIVRTNNDLTQISIGKVLVEDAPSYVHVISVTDNYAVLCEHPVFMDLGKSLLMKGALLPTLGRTRIHIFDLDGEKLMQTFEAPPCWAYHHVNAYEDGFNVILEIIAYNDAAMINGPHAYLYIENMKSEKNRMKQAMEGNLVEVCDGFGVRQSQS